MASAELQYGRSRCGLPDAATTCCNAHISFNAHLYSALGSNLALTRSGACLRNAWPPNQQVRLSIHHNANAIKLAWVDATVCRCSPEFGDPLTVRMIKALWISGRTPAM